MKRICAWCGNDVGDIPPYEDDDVTHTMCQECHKKERKGKPDCECLATCPFFNDSTYGMPEIYKDRYCREDFRWCGRYMAFKAEERERGKNMPKQETIFRISGNNRGLAYPF